LSKLFFAILPEPFADENEFDNVVNKSKFVVNEFLID